jgi:hypothetical protein
MKQLVLGERLQINSGDSQPFVSGLFEENERSRILQLL